MSNLPMDIIVYIFSRLPVKSLLRFRCVSKSWCVLIDSRNFIKMHLHRSIENNSNLNLILIDEEIYAIDFDLLDNAVKLNHPLRNSRVTYVLGSCNGLLLLGNMVFGNMVNGLAIWNPSTRKCHKLPYSPVHSPNYSDYLRHAKFGFGYDFVGEDYKVIRIVQFYCEEYDSFSSEVKVYSLKSNSWRRIQDFPYYLCLGLGGGVVLASGALHLLAKQRRDLTMPNSIVAFDVGVEEYRVVSQPEYLDGSFHMNLEVLGGCLCVTCSYYIGHLDIWMMKDYGVKESWTKLLSVVPPTIRPFEYMKPLAYSKGGGEILFDFDDKRLLWYDLSGKFVKEAKVRGMPYSFDAEVCVGSLVPHDGYGQLDGAEPYGQGEMKENKNRKKRDDFLSEGFKLVL